MVKPPRSNEKHQQALRVAALPIFFTFLYFLLADLEEFDDSLRFEGSREHSPKQVQVDNDTDHHAVSARCMANRLDINHWRDSRRLTCQKAHQQETQWNWNQRAFRSVIYQTENVANVQVSTPTEI